ncbi:hypothetical protein KR054_010674 [Drosophila jambulina]|nr:hypothetical protein KR054_010674 [Drosophila jambulina]
MKFILILACLVLYVSLTCAQDSCRGSPRNQTCIGGRDEGHRNGRNCRRSAMPEMWYFNRRTRDCVKMRYHGCGGNRNRYCSIRSCRRSCG